MKQDDFVLEEIDGYKLIEKIGEGGMAAVYKGVQLSLNRPVAIKVLLASLRAGVGPR
jgi:serine/threonine-protein kinase